MAASMIYKRDLVRPSPSPLYIITYPSHLIISLLQPDAPTSPKRPPATSGGSTSSGTAATIVPLDEYSYLGLGPVENAIMRYFKANPSVLHGHHLREILYGTQKIAPESMSGPRDEQLRILVYVVLLVCVVGGRLMPHLTGMQSTPLPTKGCFFRRGISNITHCVNAR
jgi:hypothetical protein